jgi:hypothetical protein
MNCSNFEMNVRVLVRAELIDAARRDAVLGHAANCVQCSDRLAGEQALIAGVRVAVAELSQQKAPARVGSALLTAFREHNQAVASNTIVTMPVKVARNWRLEAVAAVILITFAMGAIYWMYSRSRAETNAAVVAPYEPATVKENSNAQGLPLKPDTQITADVVTATPSKPRPRAARHRVEPREEVTEFFLMDGVDLDSLEAVQAVRVELPASALSELGLQTGREMGTGPVKADVLLGIDGMARAIRFVR